MPEQPQPPPEAAREDDGQPNYARPFRILEARDHDGRTWLTLVDCNGLDILGAQDAGSRSELRRIAACLSACAGIPTATLEAMQGGRLHALFREVVFNEAEMRREAAELLKEFATGAPDGFLDMQGKRVSVDPARPEAEGA